MLVGADVLRELLGLHRRGLAARRGAGSAAAGALRGREQGLALLAGELGALQGGRRDDDVADGARATVGHLQAERILQGALERVSAHGLLDLARALAGQLRVRPLQVDGRVHEGIALVIAGSDGAHGNGDLRRGDDVAGLVGEDLGRAVRNLRNVLLLQLLANAVHHRDGAGRLLEVLSLQALGIAILHLAGVHHLQVVRRRHEVRVVADLLGGLVTGALHRDTEGAVAGLGHRDLVPLVLLDGLRGFDGPLPAIQSLHGELDMPRMELGVDHLEVEGARGRGQQIHRLLAGGRRHLHHHAHVEHVTIRAHLRPDRQRRRSLLFPSEQLDGIADSVLRRALHRRCGARRRRG
mmetsp:Transcript_2597/g.6677  ORF Transcript_2597/g.6677 Transcript_2597/m.6677 type:complete len:352 (-) Transcript_2597:209-1264(-)